MPELMEQAPEIDVGVEVLRIGLERAAICVARLLGFGGFERAAALEPIGVRSRRWCDGLEEREPPARRCHLKLKHILPVIGTPLRLAFAYNDRVTNRANPQSRQRHFVRKLRAQPAQRTHDSRRWNLCLG